MRKGPSIVEFSHCAISRKPTIDSKELLGNGSTSRSMRITEYSPPTFDPKVLEWRDDIMIDNPKEPIMHLVSSSNESNHNPTTTTTTTSKIPNNVMKQPTRIVLGNKSSPFKSIRDKIVRSLSFKDKNPKQVNVVPRKEKESSSSTRQVVHTSHPHSLPINEPLQGGKDSFRLANTYSGMNVLPPNIDPPPQDGIDSFRFTDTYSIPDSLPTNRPPRDGIDSFRSADTYSVTNVLPPRIDTPPGDGIIDSFRSVDTSLVSNVLPPRIDPPPQVNIDSFRSADTYSVTNVLPPRIHPPPRDGIDSFRLADTYAIEERQMVTNLVERARELEERASTFEHQSRMMSIKGQAPYNMSSIRECLMQYSKSSDDMSTISELELIKRCVEEKRDLALELASEIRARVAERASSDEALRNVKTDMEFKLKLLQKENEAKARETIEEMESEWSMKLEVATSKGMKMRERLNRIAQEKVELHKEISLLASKKNALAERVHECEETIKALRMSKVGSMGSSSQEKEELPWSVVALTKEYREKEEGLVEKQSELEKVCNEKVKTLHSLRLVLGEQTKCQELGSFSEDLMRMIRMEMVRLCAIEQALRQEVESHKKETLIAPRMEKSGDIAESLGDMTKNESMVGSRYRVFLDHLEDHIKMFSCRESEEVERLRQDIRGLVQERDKLQEEMSNLHSALTLTNQTIKDLESRLTDKARETQNIYEELGRTRDQRDAMKKDADFMCQEAIRLMTQVEKLNKRVENLDDEVMLKDGQLSILLGVLQSSSD